MSCVLVKASAFFILTDYLCAKADLRVQLRVQIGEECKDGLRDPPCIALILTLLQAAWSPVLTAA